MNYENQICQTYELRKKWLFKFQWYVLNHASSDCITFTAGTNETLFFLFLPPISLCRIDRSSGSNPVIIKNVL